MNQKSQFGQKVDHKERHDQYAVEQQKCSKDIK